MAIDIDAEILGVDVFVPDDPAAGPLVTPTGDLALAVGRDAVRQGLRRRMIASPGDLVHRPDYGGGLVAMTERPMTLAATAEVANRLRRQALRDPRLADAKTSVATSNGRLDVELRVRLRQTLGDEQLTISTMG